MEWALMNAERLLSIASDFTLEEKSHSVLSDINPLALLRFAIYGELLHLRTRKKESTRAEDVAGTGRISTWRSTDGLNAAKTAVGVNVAHQSRPAAGYYGSVVLLSQQMMVDAPRHRVDEKC